MIIQSFFSKDAEPIEGLTPIIIIRETETWNLIINNENVSEVWEWIYFYDFINLDESKNYSIRIDWWNILEAWDRYTFAWIWKSEDWIKLSDLHKYHWLDKDFRVKVSNDKTEILEWENIVLSQNHSDDWITTIITRNE